MAQPHMTHERPLRNAAGPVAVFAVVAVWLMTGWGGPTPMRALRIVATVGFPSFALLGALRAVRHGHGRQRGAWMVMVVGLVALEIGSVAAIYHRYRLGRVQPLYPSSALVGFSIFIFIGCITVLMFPAGYRRLDRFRMLLDGAIVAAALFVVAWVTLLREVYYSTHMETIDKVLSMACPVTGVVTVTVAILALARSPRRWRLPMALLTAGLTLIAATGSAYVYLLPRDGYLIDSPLGLGWSAGLMMIGLAALIDPLPESPDPDDSPPVLASMWLPYIPLAIAGVFALTQFGSTFRSDPGLAAAPWLMCAVLARQFMVVAENRRLLHSASHRALRDPLTDLANRELFHDRLQHAIQLYHRDQRPVAVLSLDLDDFKVVNDNLGHAAGDCLLLQAGQRLLTCVRSGDTVARLGGDEFAVLIEDAGENAHLIVYQIVEAFERPFSVEDEPIFIRISAGLALTAVGDADVTGFELLKNADMAMYSAKRSGGGLQTFSPDIHCGSAHAGFSPPGPQSARGGFVEVRLLSDLRQAISQRALTVLYQPKVDLRTARVVGAEALVRWPHPVFGMVQPQQFLPLVRQHGLMRSFTDLILDVALGDVAHWRRRGIAIPVAVNLFPPLVGDVNLPARVFDALARHDVPGESLIVEITEDLLMDNIDQTRQVLETLRERSIHIALDDFGSGYSALTYLRTLPIDEVKVDYDLISDVLSDPRAEAIVSAVIDLSHALNLTTVAEGVENADTADWLRNRGCEVAQGILYSPPITSTALMDLLVTPKGALT